MATQRWAIRDAGIAHFFNIKTGKLVASLPTLKTAGIEFTGETTYSRGGLGNPKLVGFSGNREGSIALQDAIFDNRALAMLTGNEPSVGKAIIDYQEIIDIANGAATTGFTPVGKITGVYEYDVANCSITNKEYTEGNPTENPSEYSVSGKEITFNSEITEGKVMVYYQVETDEESTTVKVTSDKFGGTFRFALDCQVVDQITQETYKAQIRVPIAKFEDNFSFDLSVDGDPAALDLNLEILKSPCSTDMYTMVIYDEKTLV